jgi:galactokinase
MDHGRLIAAGMGSDTAQTRAVLFERAAAALGGGAALAVWAPGRIEVLGKHVDYGGGRSIVIAVERGFCFVARPRDDDRLVVFEASSGERVECRGAVGQAAASSWANYVATVAGRVAGNFAGPLRGADVAFVSDLPIASGLSSSSALVVGLFLVLDGVNGLRERPEYRETVRSCEELGEYLGAVENGRTFKTLAGERGVGTLGGNQDQTAILCCEAGRLSRFAYMPARREGTLAVPGEVTFVVASSGVEAAKTGGAMERYNRASRLLARVLEVANADAARADPTLMAALSDGPDAIARVRAAVARQGDVTLGDRFEHFVSEVSEIVPGAWEAWRKGDWAGFGRIVDRSQEGAEVMLKNQVPETVHLARRARELGATAASAFGAGFGGSVWALVTREGAEEFRRRWRDDYSRHFPQHAARARFFGTTAGPAAFAMNR